MGDKSSAISSQSGVLLKGRKVLSGCRFDRNITPLILGQCHICSFGFLRVFLQLNYDLKWLFCEVRGEESTF